MSDNVESIDRGRVASLLGAFVVLAAVVPAISNLLLAERFGIEEPFLVSSLPVVAITLLGILFLVQIQFRE